MNQGKGGKMNATIVGVLFITATVASIVAGLFLQPVLDDPDYLNNGSANENRVAIGALLELVAAGAVVGTAVMLFPVFKTTNEGLALGYVGGRTIEGAIIIIGAIGALLLLVLPSGRFINLVIDSRCSLTAAS